MKLLTVMTPTYNRAGTLGKVYDSLCKQTCQDFLWMIIDDGSTDQTEDMVSEWINENKIAIEYYKKENGGKASALNLGIGNLRTRFAVCLDSDDTFYENAVELALQQLKETVDDERCCGILALRNNPDGTVMGCREIPKDCKYVTAADVFLKFRLKTELICFYKSELLKQNLFPEFAGEKFVSPAWMQYKITEDHYYQSSWDKLCICEYIADGLTRNKRKIIARNPRGYQAVKRYSFQYSKRPRQIMKHGIMYDCACLIGRDRDWLKNAPKKVWAVILMPAAFVVYHMRFSKLMEK